ncbi:nucleotide sugar dehydrogenase [Streptomyces sp. NPDC017520]|uniref:nucleotide sugar dehydrogenase n=1 Tax=Streptomyces sp. NPDC017520 TaxID=3364998 RepID=UPI0037B728D9
MPAREVPGRTTGAVVTAQSSPQTVVMPAQQDGAEKPIPPVHLTAAGPRAVRTVAVVGLGYVGLPTALALRATGSHVIGIDISAARLSDIRSRRVDLLPDQLRLLAEAGEDTGFRLTDDVAAMGAADAVILCVPTPVDRDQVPDLRMLSAACAAAVRHSVAGQLLILTSTSYVGTTRDLLIEPLRARGLDAGTEVFVAFAPERIDPGNAAHGQERTPRVVGGEGPLSTERAVALLSRTAPSVHCLDSPEAAEMTKLWENTFRAVNIALANELSDNCRVLGLDPRPVIEAAATKPFGFMPFYPGPGVGGHCIPCDPHYLLWQLRARNARSPLVDAAMQAIAQRPRVVVRQVLERLATGGVPCTGAKILIVGIAYKEGVADLRGSPALEVHGQLASAGARVGYLDPLVPVARLGGTLVAGVTDPGAVDWDLVVIHTLHPGTDLGWLRPDTPVLDVGHRRATITGPGR